MSNFISLENLSKRYSTPHGDFFAIKDLSFEISQGQLLAIVGKSGSGKSTLLNMLTGIDHPTTGKVTIQGTVVHAMEESAMARWRGANIGIVFQFFQLVPTLTVRENLLLAMEFVDAIPKNRREKRVNELLSSTGVAGHASKFPAALSGGEQQRVAIARALANDPPIVIADEPTGNLDSETTESIQKMFKQLAAQGKTVIVVTHDTVTSAGYHRVLTMRDGCVIKDEEVSQ